MTQLLTETLGERVLDDPDAPARRSSVSPTIRALSQRYQHARAGQQVAARAVHPRRRPACRSIRDALFDVHIKRIHEYKRQLLNMLETIALYQEMRAQPDERLRAAREDLRRQGGGELSARQADHQARQRRRRAWSTTTRRRRPAEGGVRAELQRQPRRAIIPAADLSEQISTAGMEASGTGNMKLALNGALTIGTLDGANIEIREQVGADNIFIFGLTAERGRRAQGPSASRARRRSTHSARLRAVVDALATGEFSPDDPNRFAPIVQSLLGLRPLHGRGRFRRLLGRRNARSTGCGASRTPGGARAS